MIDPDFYNNVEKPNYLNYVLYGDTDSIFLNVPFIDTDNIKEKIEKSNQLASEVNNAIIKILNMFILPRCGVSKEYNYTDFKTELIIEALLLLDVKKTYALSILAKKGKIFSKPKIDYVGMNVKKTNFAELTKRIMRHLVEEIALNTKIEKSQKFRIAKEYINEVKKEMKEYCKEYRVDIIGRPTKMSTPFSDKNPPHIEAMRLWNEIAGSEDWIMWAAGHLAKTNIGMLAFPTLQKGLDYCRKVAESKNIKINEEEMWNDVISTCIPVLEILSKYTTNILDKYLK